MSWKRSISSTIAMNQPRVQLQPSTEKGATGRFPNALPMQGSTLLALCLQGSFPALEEPQPGCCWRCVHIQDRHSLKCHQLGYIFSDYFKSVDFTLWNQYPSIGKSAQVLITESRRQLLPVVWSEKIHNFKANLYRLTPERCWKSATSPENEGCKPLST